MKDIIIKGERIKKELKTLLYCFIFVMLLNIFSIIFYHTKWTEILTTLHYIIILTLVVYFITGIFRILFISIFCRKNK